MFNVIEHAGWASPIEGARVLDLFAGSGALGLEALSRGAAFCLFVDCDASARAAIANNAGALGFGGRCEISADDAARLPPARLAPAFDLAFLDPPYGDGQADPALTGLIAGSWLRPGAIVVVERGAAERALAAPGYRRVDERSWGAARVVILSAP